MKRRSLDLLFSVGGVGLAVLLLVLGLVLTSNASFARTYVAGQMAEQRIAFKPAEKLTAEERESECLVANAGKALTTGKQAECYANDFIGLHVKSTANANGLTYAELGDVQTGIRTRLAAAQTAGDPTVGADLQKQLTDTNTARESLFKGETLRGLLLTSYGFSVFGEKAAQFATIAYLAAGLLLLLSIAGFMHAFKTPENELFAAPATGAPAPGAARRPVKV